MCILKTSDKRFTTSFNVSHDFYAETRDIAYTPSKQRTKNCELNYVIAKWYCPPTYPEVNDNGDKCCEKHDEPSTCKETCPKPPCQNSASMFIFRNTLHVPFLHIRFQNSWQKMQKRQN